MSMVVCDGLVKIYAVDGLEVVALQGLDLTVEEGEMMAVIGNSGSGKSTLLNILGGLIKPSAGKIFVAGRNLLELDEADLVRYKLETVGFVWQNNARNLLPYLTAEQNVMMPMLLAGKADHARAAELLDAVGLGHRRRNRLTELSGGEQQRVAVALALANRPQLLLADEPTGSLDEETSRRVLNVLRRLNDTYNLTVIVVTHDPVVARQVDRYVAIRDGRTATETVRRVDLETLESLGDSAKSHQEYAVMDRAGRIQIPEAVRDELGLKKRIELTIEDDRVVLKRPDETRSGGEGE